jgi:predicted anti-sigma-YlaC factor YlaD
MLSCKEITELATDYLDKDLPWRKRLQVRAHLWMCAHCRRYMEQMRMVVELMRRLPAEPLPPQLLDKLLPRFREMRDRHA